MGERKKKISIMKILRECRKKILNLDFQEVEDFFVAHSGIEPLFPE